MASNVGLGDTELLILLNQRFGTKKLVQYYLRKASVAASQAKVDLINQNPHALGGHAQQMIDAIAMMEKILGDDAHTLEVDITAPKQ